VQNSANDSAELKAVNERLGRGEGWIGYLFTKRDGAQVPSKFLYAQFYAGKEQKRINTRTNDVEEAYRILLDNRRRVNEGERVLPSEASKLKYEDLIEKLMDYYRTDHPTSLRTRKTEDGATEETFDGKDNLDEFFGGMTVTEITATKVQEYIKKYSKMGYKGATIRRQLSRLKSAFERARDLDLITANHIPSFRLPKDSKPREGFLELEDFQTFLNSMPERLRLTVRYLYFTGSRVGEVEQITWSMVSRDCREINIPGRITKTDDGRTVPLVGPLAEISEALQATRKKFPKAHDSVFDFTNFRRMWNRTCHKLGLGVYDEKGDNRRYSGLHPHDFRRSAARNLIKAGVPRSTAMMITGHKTEAIFERYNIKDNSDAEAALLKVGQYSTGKVAAISGTR
jgi:integrase